MNNTIEFKYMMLSRLQADCEYYLGYGSRNEKNLFYLNKKEHIEEMKNLYNSLPEKPEWLTLEKIEEYEKLMNNDETYTLKEDGIKITGSSFIYLNEKIRDEELCEYSIVDRESFIDELIHWISEAKGNDKFLMMDDLKMLLTWSDEYILTSNSTNHYIGSHSCNFNDVCEELIKLNSEINNG